MKLLIGYDGSQCADAALDDLTHAGLPLTGEAVVLTVAEIWLPPPPPSAIEIVELANNEHGTMGLESRYMAGSQTVRDAGEMAARAAERFQANFPKWSVKHEAVWGSPTWHLYSRAEDFKADLIVVGSHGRSALGRFFLGSISQWLLNEARCSVRVARGKLDEADFPVRLIVGVDGSINSMLAVEELGARTWPDKSEVRVVCVEQLLEPTLVGELMPNIRRMVEDCIKEDMKDGRHLVVNATESLCAKGLRAEGLVKFGDPKRILVNFAEEWRADCIFLGATGLSNRLDRFLLGSVAGAIAARADCSVEIVRRRSIEHGPNGNGN